MQPCWADFRVDSVATDSIATGLQGAHYVKSYDVICNMFYTPPPANCCRARTIREPLAAYICETLPEHKRKSSRLELMYEDFAKLESCH